MTILKTQWDGCYELTTNSFGSYLKQVSDPDFNVEISDEQIEGFEIDENFQKIPASLWQRWIQLCLEMTRRSSSNLEVSCRLLRNEEDSSQWRIVVPKQVVSSASVRVDSFDSCIDIETGEVIEQYPPLGWIPCGSSHSHNTMAAFFSGTDDKYEIGYPGLHVVVGSINIHANTYQMKASITANKRRFDIKHQDVIDSYPVQGLTFHPEALNLIKIEDLSRYNNPNKFKNNKANVVNHSSKSQSYYKSWHDIDEYKNPFHWQDTYVNGNGSNSEDVNDPFLSLELANVELSNIDFSNLSYQETLYAIDELKNLASNIDDLIKSLEQCSEYFFDSAV